MWLATQGRGIFYLKNTDTTNFMEQRYSTKNGLASDIAWSVLQDHAGTMWFGTKEGLCRLRKGKLSTFTIKDGLPSNVIYALMEAHDGALWVGTSGGLCCIRKGVFTSYTSSTATNPHKNNGHNNNLPNDRVFNLLEDRDSALWIGTNDGLSRFKNGVFTNFFTRNGLSHNAIHTLAQDSEGTIWIGTIGGLTRLKNGVLQSITTKQGLYNDVVYGILSDNNGYFWISCNKGIYRVRKDSLNACADGKLKQLSCQAFGTEDGMKSAECNGGTQPAAWKSRDGHLWFATIRGAVSVNPNDVFFNPLPPYVIIESIKADTTALDLTATATVEADVQKFEFYYTATSLLVPDKVQFRYMLEGYDESWVEAGSRRVAYYTNLQRGRTYRFRVCACNNDGVWNDVGASSAMLYLAPYIWETWWAYSLYAALALSSAVLLVRYRERNQRRLLKQQYREREARHIYEKNLLLEETNVRLENLNVQLSDANANLSALNEEKSDIVGVVAHDLKNPVIGIQKLAYSLEGQARKSGLVQMQQSAAIIKDTAERMFTMIQQLLKVHAAEFGDNALTPITVDLGELAEKLRRDWQERAESQSVQLAVSIASKNPITAYADPFAFLQILENLLSNAVKVSPPNSVVRIWLGYESGYAVVEVQDFGAGMSMEHQQLLFSKFIRLSHKQQSGLPANGLPQNELLQSKSTENEHSSGLGLYIVKKLTEAMNGKIHCVSAIGQGTTFTLFLPITSHKAAPPPSTRTPIEKPHH
jgi:signal transduction histidine kinase